MTNVHPLRSDMTPNPMLLTPRQQYATRQLAVRYCAYQDARDKAKGARLADQKWGSVACWAGMLRDTQIETGVTIIDNEYLVLVKQWANAQLRGDGAEAMVLIIRMAESKVW